jgi:4-amino-4-deoxy-L-arabinose transferase-like glycosyltransferase
LRRGESSVYNASIPRAVAFRPESHEPMRRNVLLLFLGSFGLRAAAVLLLGEYKTPNVWESGVIARALVAGHGFAFDWRAMLGTPPEPDVASTWWPPAYPAFLAACHIAAPRAPWLLASLLQAAMLALIPVLLLFMGRRLVGERAAWAAALLAAVHPPLLGYASLIQTAAFEIFWTTLALHFVTRASGLHEPADTGSPPARETAHAKGGGRRDAFLAGLATAAGALTRGPTLALVVIAPLAWLLAGLPGRRVLARTAFLLLGAALLLAPWAARNHHVRGTFVLLSSKEGWNLFMGNNPVPAISSPWDLGQAIRPEMRARLMTMNEVEGNRYLRGLAAEYVRTHPGQTLRNIGRRAKCLVWFNEAFGTRSGYSSMIRRLTRPVYMIAWPALLAAAIAGMVVARRAWRRFAALYGMIGAIAAVILLTFFENRYRAPLEPVLLPFAGAAVARLTDARSRRATPEVR